MTILDMLNKANEGNSSMQKSLDIIRDSFTNLVNDNYELVVLEDGELNVRIPSLEKRNEYVHKNIGEYPYPLVMCMRIRETKNREIYHYILNKFTDIYKDKLNLFFKDVNTVYKLKEQIIQTKNTRDYITYTALTSGVVGTILLCIIQLTEPANRIFIASVIVFFITALVVQITKESKVETVINAYLSLIKTDWYREELSKQHSFFCNLME